MVCGKSYLGLARCKAGWVSSFIPFHPLFEDIIIDVLRENTDSKPLMSRMKSISCWKNCSASQIS